MEYRTVSTKLPTNELTLFRAHCEKKGVSPAYLMRELLLKEMKITVPHIIAGKNKIYYDKKADAFTWFIELDNEKKIEVLKNIAPAYIEELHKILKLGLEERHTFIHKKKKNSVPVPSNILGGER